MLLKHINKIAICSVIFLAIGLGCAVLSKRDHRSVGTYNDMFYLGYNIEVNLIVESAEGVNQLEKFKVLQIDDPQELYKELKMNNEKMIDLWEREKSIVDRWGWPYSITSKRQSESDVLLVIKSRGRDGEWGTGDDVVREHSISISI